MDNADHIRAKRDQVKEKIRNLNQEVGQFSVRPFFISLVVISNMPVWEHVSRTNKNKSTVI